MSSTNSPEAVKKLLENMQSDLRALSLECKKKFPPVKEVSFGRRGEEARGACPFPSDPVLPGHHRAARSGFHLAFSCPVGGMFHKRLESFSLGGV